MRLNPKSWHACWFKFVGPDTWLPNDLCSYFWMWNLLTLRFAVLLAACLFFLSAICYVVIVAFKIVCMAVLAGSYIAFLIFAVADWHERHEGEPSVVGAWISAKKRGICPLIEWVEKEEGKR